MTRNQMHCLLQHGTKLGRERGFMVCRGIPALEAISARS